MRPISSTRSVTFFHRARQACSRPGGVQGQDDEDDGLLFTSATATAIRHNTFNATVWKPALRSAGVDDTDRRNGMHRARHTFAAVLLHEGESVAAVAEWMGNTPAVVLRTYAHLMPASEDRTRRVIDAAFSTSGVTSVSLGG